MQRLPKFLFLILLAQTAFADPITYTRVLLPIYLDGTLPGAYGSLWQSRFSVHNSASIDYTIDTCSEVNSVASTACLLILYADEDLRPNETQSALPARYPKPVNGTATVVYLLPDPAAAPSNPSDLSFELRITDISRSATNAGTEVPVVRKGNSTPRRSACSMCRSTPAFARHCASSK